MLDIVATELEKNDRETRETLAQIEKRLNTNMEFGDDAAKVTHYRKMVEHYSVRAKATRAAVERLRADVRRVVPAEPPSERVLLQCGHKMIDPEQNDIGLLRCRICRLWTGRAVPAAGREK